MKCLQVYPILKKTWGEILTYWTQDNSDLSVGDIIEIKIRNTKHLAVVENILSIYESKEYIRNQSYIIKKIDKIIKIPILSKEFILAAYKTSLYYINDFGEILSELIPKKILYEFEIPVKNKDINHFNIYPIKDFIDKNKDKRSNILPIDLYKIDHENLNSIEIHNTDSNYYRHIFKNFDYRYFLYEYAKLRKIKLIKNDINYHLQNYKNDIILINSKNSKTKFLKTNKNINKPEINDKVDLNNLLKSDIDIISHKKLNLITPEILSLIKYCYKNKKTLALYTLKKGLNSSLICDSCKQIQYCNICQKNLEISSDNLICKNNHKYNANDFYCKFCNSDLILPLGITTESVKKELENIIEQEIIIVDNNQDKKNIKNINMDFKYIHVGTDKLINKTYAKKFDYIAVLSIDTLFNIPCPNIEIEAIRIINELIQRVNNNILIQTRDIDNIFFKSLLKKDFNILINNLNQTYIYNKHIQICINKNDYKFEYIKNSIISFIKKIQENIYMTENYNSITLHIFSDKIDDLNDKILNIYLKSLPKSVKIQVDLRDILE